MREPIDEIFSLSIVRKISGIGFQPVDVKSQAGRLCHNEEPTVIIRSMLKSPATASFRSIKSTIEMRNASFGMSDLSAFAFKQIIAPANIGAIHISIVSIPAFW